MYYFLIATATALFSFQFLFNQKFQERCGSSSVSSQVFSLFTSVFGFVVLFAVNGFKMDFSWISLIIAAIYAVNGILYIVASVKSFDAVNLSVYSVFAMLGGMLLPSVYGIIFRGEDVTFLKILCYLFIIAALFFETDFKQKSSKKIYYAAVFVLNGMNGVITVIHQSVQNYTIVDSFSFLMLARIFAALVSMAILAKDTKQAVKMVDLKSLIYSFGFAVFCTVGNLLLLIAVKHLPASVQYPLVTGGVMLISLLISLVRKENVRTKELIATAIAFASTLLIAFQG